MRFEKLNENKIRITLTNRDLAEENIDFHSFMSNSIETQDLFFEMLDKAEKEIGFVTKDYQIRIEALQVASGDFILTVTRGLPISDKKKIHIRRKKIESKSKQVIYGFNSFDDFCSFSALLNTQFAHITNIAKSICLYEYKQNYYLNFCNINQDYPNLKKIFSIITEFAIFIDNADLFNSKLVENGKLLIKNNAIKTAIKYFK